MRTGLIGLARLGGLVHRDGTTVVAVPAGMLAHRAPAGRRHARSAGFEPRARAAT